MTAWAIVKKGKIVRDEKRLNTLLVFKTRAEAVANIWEESESVAQVILELAKD